jgi:hypothetical protein
MRDACARGENPTRPGSERRAPRLLWLTGLGAGFVATALNSGIAAAARRLLGVPDAFAPFTLGPLATGSVGGALGVVATFAVLRRLTRRPLP